MNEHYLSPSIFGEFSSTVLLLGRYSDINKKTDLQIILQREVKTQPEPLSRVHSSLLVWFSFIATDSLVRLSTIKMKRMGWFWLYTVLRMTDDTVRYSQKTIWNDNMEQSAKSFFNISVFLMLDAPIFKLHRSDVKFRGVGKKFGLSNAKPQWAGAVKKDHSNLSPRALWGWGTSLGAGSKASWVLLIFSEMCPQSH